MCRQQSAAITQRRSGPRCGATTRSERGRAGTRGWCSIAVTVTSARPAARWISATTRSSRTCDFPSTIRSIRSRGGKLTKRRPWRRSRPCDSNSRRPIGVACAGCLRRTQETRQGSLTLRGRTFASCGAHRGLSADLGSKGVGYDNSPQTTAAPHAARSGDGLPARQQQARTCRLHDCLRRLCSPRCRGNQLLALGIRDRGLRAGAGRLRAANADRSVDPSSRASMARPASRLLMPALVVIALSMAGAAGQLRVHTSSSTRMPSSLIVGRAVCSHGTWLLTEHQDLILITHPARQVTVHRLEGLRTNDRLWGLACLTDGTLWSLATPRVLIRIGAEGVVRERVELRFPRVAVFGWTDRLLFIDLPMLIAKPLLATAIPRSRGESMPWPRFLGRAAEARADLIARNLVNCGIGSGRNLPCWFADERRVIVSDGASANTVSFAALAARD